MKGLRNLRGLAVVSLCVGFVVIGSVFGAGGDMGAGTEALTDGSENYPYLIEDLTDFDVFANPANSATYWAREVYTELAFDPNLAGRTYTAAVIAPNTSTTSYFGFEGAYFRGVFDGGGHTISNLTIDTAGAGAGYLGLFGFIDTSGKIKNLGLENVSITVGVDSRFLGGLCGLNYGSISNCYTIGAVTGGDGSDYLGGLCGWSNGSISTCYARSAVTGGDSSRYLGGLCGYNFGISISNCYSTGAVTGGYSVARGGLCGDNAGIISNCFWDIETSGTSISSGGTGRTTAEMQTESTFTAAPASWDFVGEMTNGPSDDWSMPETTGYPIFWWQLIALPELPSFSGGSGTANDPYIIANANDLNAIGHNLRLIDKHFILVNDIDLSGVNFFIISNIFNPFTGVFDGGGHTISNLTIDTAGAGIDFLGLFVHVGAGSEVKNLGLEDVSITSGTNFHFIGGLCGINSGIISNCYVTGTMTGSSGIGGLCVWNYGTISNCYARCEVTGGDSYFSLGGLCGSNYGSISDCSARGAVTGVDDSDRLGGLCGLNYGSISNCYSRSVVTGGYSSWYLGGLCGRNEGIISTCYAIGAVISGDDSHDLGGLCGMNSSTGNISNCYARGSMTGGDDSEQLGGLCGVNSSTANISNCYATGAVTGGVGSHSLGGLCGRNYGDISTCFWDIDVGGPDNGYGTGLSTDLMQTRSTFTDVGWDFVGLWDICEGSNYARFLWQIGVGDFVCPDGVGVEDLLYFVGYWLDGGLAGYEGGDLTGEGDVDLADWAIFSLQYLE